MSSLGSQVQVPAASEGGSSCLHPSRCCVVFPGTARPGRVQRQQILGPQWPPRHTQSQNSLGSLSLTPPAPNTPSLHSHRATTRPEAINTRPGMISCQYYRERTEQNSITFSSQSHNTHMTMGSSRLQGPCLLSPSSRPPLHDAPSRWPSALSLVLLPDSGISCLFVAK